MRAVWKELGITAMALMIATAAVVGLGDRSVFVPPPEHVAEEFVRKLTTGRYSPARSHLARSLTGEVTTDSLRQVARDITPAGGAIKLEGKAGAVRGDAAWPLVRLVSGHHDTVDVRVRLVWEEGGWKVAAVPSGRGRS